MGHKRGEALGGKQAKPHCKRGKHHYVPSVAVERERPTRTDWGYAGLEAECCRCHPEAHDDFGCLTCPCQRRFKSPRQAPDDPAWVRIERLVAGKAFHKKVKHD